MKSRHEASRGYSMAELLTVVAIIGLVSAVSLPALMQLMPQYRIRGAAAEVTASLRMLRAKSVGTRSNWRMTLDPTNDGYTLASNSSGAWVDVDQNGKPIVTGQPAFRKLNTAEVGPGTAPIIVEFTRNGSAAAAQTVIIATDNQLIRYNRYTITIDASGNVTVVPSKV